MRLYHTTNERNFNAVMNELAGTRNVTYSGVWPMHVSDGQQYLKTNKHDVARVYAGELLHGRVKEGSVLALHDNHLSDKQRTALSYLRQCRNAQFDAALRLCEFSHALPRSAMHLFQDPVYTTKFTIKEQDAPADVHKEQDAPADVHMADKPSGVAEQVSAAAAAASTPPRTIALNAPPSASRGTIALQSKSKKPRRK